MKKGLKTVLLAAAAMITANAANASTFTYGSYNIIGGTSVTITSPVSLTALAGETQLIGAGLNVGQTIDAWCLDLLTTLQAGPYTYQISPLTMAGAGGGNPTLTSTQMIQIGDLMLNGLGVSDKAAIQLAIWTIEYPTFSTLGVTGTLLSDETADLNNVANTSSIWWNSSVQVNLLHDAAVAPNQTLAFVTPLPATLPLFATGLGALGLLGWRRKRKAIDA